MIEHAKLFADRRRRLMATLKPGSVGILVAAPIAKRSADVAYPYRPSSNFYYMTGFEEPDALAVFVPGRADGEFILFCQPRDPAQETWTGSRIGPEGACRDYSADQAYDIATAHTFMPELLSQYEKIYVEAITPAEENAALQPVHAQVRDWQNSRETAIDAFSDINPLINEMRLIKSAVEIDAMRQAVAISVAAHQRARQVCKPGAYEYTLEAAFAGECLARGSRSLAYPSIVGSGANSCVLHYEKNNAQLKDGDLVLIDAGAEYNYYAADITRTFPVSGRFSDEQRAIYDSVLKTQLMLIDAVKPGADWQTLTAIGLRKLTEELLALGLLQGELDQLLEDKAAIQFSVHSFGHWIGLDVHDVGSYKLDEKDEHGENLPRPFEPGMVLTIEPGIYIPATMENVDARWHNIGIRIEDDVLVTTDGCEVLSNALPKTIPDIENANVF